MIIPEQLNDQESIWDDEEDSLFPSEELMWFESNKPSRLRAQGRKGRSKKDHSIQGGRFTKRGKKRNRRSF